MKRAAARSPRVRVLFVSHSGLLNGAQRSLLDLVQALSRRKQVEAFLITPEGPLAHAAERGGITVSRIPVPWWISRPGAAKADPLRAWWRRRRLRRRLASAADAVARAAAAWRADLVHSNSLASPVGAMAAERLGVPHVWHLREFVEEDMRSHFLLGRAASLRPGAQSRRVVCNSQAVKDRFAPELGVPVDVVHNGFRFRAKPPTRRAARPPVLLAVGTLRPGKGHEEALAAVARLAAAGVDVGLEVAGDGTPPYVRMLEGLAQRLSIARQVKWLGHVQDLAPVFQRATLLVASAPSEAFGRTVVEAHDHALPVVAADAAGYRETVQDGVTGLLYRPGDAIALADAVQRLLEDPRRAARMAAAGRRDAMQRFGLPRHVEAMERLLLDAARGPA